MKDGGMLRSVALLGSFLGLFAAGPAAGFAILPLEDGRINVATTETETQSATPSSDFADFDEAVFFVGPSSSSFFAEIEQRRLRRRLLTPESDA